MRITKFGHACVRIEHDGQVVVLDPGVFTDPEAVDGATAVLVTHVHPDHLHAENLRATDARIFTVGQVAEQLASEAPDVAERTVTVPARKVLSSARQAQRSRPLMTMAQEPHMPTRHA